MPWSGYKEDEVARPQREGSGAAALHSMLGDGFQYRSHPQRVIFGRGKVESVGAEVEAIGARRALVLSTPQQRAEAEGIAVRLGDASAGIFSEAAMHTPVEITERAMAALRETHADCIVSIGGGSTIGLGKAIAWRTDLPQVVIPTTYAGSEMTPILGQTENGVKATLSSPKILPEVVIYDADLTLGLPPMMTATSGMNAIAHAVEGLYAENRNPVISLIACEAIRVLSGALRVLHRDPRDMDARLEAQYGAWLCGHVLGSVGMALHHKLCHTLGGSFDLPHAETHTVILPHAAAFNASGDPEALAATARALKAPQAGQGLFDLALEIGAPKSLRAIGMRQEDLDEAAAIATRNPYWNPRSFSRDEIRDLLDDAYFGRRPEH